ncbi:MAG: nucleotidyltransferase domain-containing protein [Nitrososphaeria archaeon]
MKNYEKVAIKVKEIISKYDGSARVIVFGSAVRGNFNAASDLDVLIISEKKELWNEMRAKIFLEFLDKPIEVHFATEDEYRNWYSRFIDAMKEF